MPETRRFSFTKKALDDIKSPEKGRISVWDTRIPKLCLRITSGGAKSFYYVTKIQTEDGPKVEWNRFGRWPGLSIDSARDAAQVVAAKYAKGDNPAEDRRQERAEWTFGKAWQEYRKYRLRKMIAQQKREQKIGASLETLDSYWRNRLSGWENRRLSSITGVTAERFQSKLLEGLKGSSVNRITAVVRAAFNHAIRRRTSGFDGPNPFDGLEKLPVVRRRTKLRRSQIPQFFAALESVSPQMQDFFLIGLWTGRRAGDIKTMSWPDVDLNDASWFIADPKGGDPEEVALSLPAIEILSRRQAESESEWVFPAHSKSGHIEEYKKAWNVLRKNAGLENLRFHDLRRTLSSLAQEHGIVSAVAGAQLGHKDPATTLKHYTDIALYAQREAVNVVAAAILEARNSSHDN